METAMNYLPGREGLSCELPLLKTFFHVMSNVESLGNQTFLS